MVAEQPQEEEELVSYAGQLAHRGRRIRGRGLFAAAGLGVLTTTAKTGTTSTTTAPDRTAADWSTALTTGGSIVGALIGGATGTPATTPATEEILDPATATAPATSASPSWYWPVLIGVGVAVLGGIAYMSYNVKAPVKSNRRRSRRLRSNYAYGSTSHPGSYDSHGRPRRNSRRRRSSRR